MIKEALKKTDKVRTRSQKKFSTKILLHLKLRTQSQKFGSHFSFSCGCQKVSCSQYVMCYIKGCEESGGRSLQLCSCAGTPLAWSRLVGRLDHPLKTTPGATNTKQPTSPNKKHPLLKLREPPPVSVNLFLSVPGEISHQSFCQ